MLLTALHDKTNKNTVSCIMVVNKILYEPKTNKTELTLTTMVDTVFKLEQFYNQ